MLFCSSLLAFSATGLPFLLAGFLTSNVTPMSCRLFASAMLCSAGAPSTRQTAGLVAFGGRTSAKSFRSPDSRVGAFSFFTRHAHVYDVAVSLRRRIFCFSLLMTSEAKCSPK